MLISFIHIEWWAIYKPDNFFERDIWSNTSLQFVYQYIMKQLLPQNDQPWTPWVLHKMVGWLQMIHWWGKTLILDCNRNKILHFLILLKGNSIWTRAHLPVSLIVCLWYYTNYNICSQFGHILVVIHLTSFPG